MCITEYNEKTFVDGIRAEGRAEGLEEGRAEGRMNAICIMIELGLPKEKILTKYSEEEYEKAEQSMLQSV